MLNFKNIYFDGSLDGGGRIWIDYVKHYDFPKFNSIMEMCCGQVYGVFSWYEIWCTRHTLS